MVQFEVRNQFLTGSDVVGADFESGVDHVALFNFGYSNAKGAFTHVRDVDGHAQFSDQETTIIFYGHDVAYLLVDDFLV